ncbi:MAG: SpoIIE family protein phosphatase [Methanolinea sp.]|nr:SpoIIE family protein phosphatase [Methanolinea sp.]
MAPIEYFSGTEKGMRDRNEDSLLAMAIGPFYLFAVAEGFGGSKEGPAPGAIAISAIEKLSGKTWKTPGELLEGALIRADEEIFQYQMANPGCEAMAAAIAVVVVGPDGSCAVSSAGDRRVRFVKDGVNDQAKNPLEEPDPNFYETRLDPGMSLLLCSDGLYDFVDEERILTVIRDHTDDLAGACRKLMSQAFQNGSDDNITTVLVRHSPDPA